MSKFVLAILLILSIASVQGDVSAQTSDYVARKFDEFGDVQYSDLIARLDNFAVALQNEPGAKGFILVYRSRRDLPGLSNRMALRSKAYLINQRGVAKERVVTVDGGDSDCLRQELWIAPSGTTPIPRDDAHSRYFADLDSPRKINEWGFDIDKHSQRRELTEYPTEADSLETFATELRRQKNCLAYIIAYAHFSKKRPLIDDDYDVHRGRRIDPPGTVRNRLLFEKKVLVKVYGINPSRIRLIDGGYRKSRTVEFWIVPRGEHTPIPTPNSFPPKRRRART